MAQEFDETWFKRSGVPLPALHKAALSLLEMLEGCLAEIHTAPGTPHRSDPLGQRDAEELLRVAAPHRQKAIELCEEIRGVLLAGGVTLAVPVGMSLGARAVGAEEERVPVPAELHPSKLLTQFAMDSLRGREGAPPREMVAKALHGHIEDILSGAGTAAP